MGDLLKNSVSITILSNGFSSKHHHPRSPSSFVYKIRHWCFRRRLCFGSGIGTNRRSAIITHETNLVTMSQPQTPPINLLIGSPPMDRLLSFRVESGMICKDEEKENLIERGKEDVETQFIQQKLPLFEDLVIHELDFESNTVSQASSVSKVKGAENLNGLHFLEERDEEKLSNRVLVLSRTNKVRSAMELYRSMVFSGFRPNLHACNSFLSCLLRNRQLDKALKVFEFMKMNKITSGHTYSLILKGFANTQGYDSALKMFMELERECKVNKGFDTIVYNTVISICGKLNEWVEAERIWRRMKENSLVGTQITYCLLVSIFARSGQADLALDAYSEMLENGFKPGQDTMQAIIGTFTKEGKLDLALSVFQNMLNNGLKPNLIACNALINSFGKAGEIKLAFKIYDVMKSLGHTPDAYTWNALLGALYRANRHADALKLFESIKKENESHLNLHLYNTALISCSKLGLWDKALQLLWQIEASGLPVSTASYNLVIGACETARKPRVALQVYEHMVHQECGPDTFTHLSLIRGCIWGSLWVEVEEILHQVAPNVSLYNAAIQGMCLKGKIDSAKKLYMKMREYGLTPDGKTRALLLQNLPTDSVSQRNRFPRYRVSNKLSSHLCNVRRRKKK